MFDSVNQDENNLKKSHFKWDIVLGFGLLGLAIIATVFIGWYMLIYLDQTMPLNMLILPAVFGIVGLLLIGSDILEETFGMKEDLHSLHKLVGDDIDDLRNFRLTRTHLFAALTAIGLLVEAYLIIYFQKWNASWWGWANVLTISILAAIFTFLINLSSEWFQYRWHRITGAVFWIPFVGFIVCALLGLKYAEPQEYGGLSLMERQALVQDEDTYWHSTRGGNVRIFTSSSSGSGASIDFDCGKKCGEGILVILLIVLVIMLIIGSALIPHFWVLATAILLTMLVSVAIREILYHPKHA